MTKEFEPCVKNGKVGNQIWNPSNTNRFGKRFLKHPQPSIWKRNKPNRYLETQPHLFIIDIHVLLWNPYAKRVYDPQHFASINQYALHLQTKMSCKLTIYASKLHLVIEYHGNSLCSLHVFSCRMFNLFQFHPKKSK